MLKEKIRMYLTLCKKENIVNYKKLKAFKKQYDGKRCWIIGNGPSLKADDLDLIAGEYSFAANRIYYIFEKTGWRPSFYMCQDPRAIENVLQDTISEKEELNSSTIFVSKVLSKRANEFFHNSISYRLCKSDDPRDINISLNVPVYFVEGLSVTYSMIQMAMYMGFKEICLLGVDHNQNTANAKNMNDLHFDKRYKIDIKDYPSVTEYEYLTNCFNKANQECKRRGIRIYNATRGGVLEAFERKSVEEILESK